MRRLDLAVVGSGMGGSMIAALNKNKDLVLFEKDKNLGGCASTFKRYGSYFNAGATTFVGYEDKHPIKRIFDELNVKPNLSKSQTAIRILQDGKVLDRKKDFEQFLKDINEIYPNANNEKFWRTIKEIDEKFWNLKKLYFAKHSINGLFKTSIFVIELLKTFKFDLFKTATYFIKETLGDISKEYQSFIDAQLFITVQTTSKEIPLLTMCLGLAYPFHDVFYVNGGMGSLFDEILNNVEIHNKEEVLNIKKALDGYIVTTKEESYHVQKLILNSTVYDSARFFEDEDIKKYYRGFEFSNQSAFVVYIKLNSTPKLLHHYQVILNENIPNCISNSFFISLSDESDEKMSKGGLSITISTHTQANYWRALSKAEYEQQKQKTIDFIIKEFLNNFDTISKEDIKTSFGATSTTFNSYINRFNCGGSAINIKNILKLPSCKTPFEGLYNVGDTVFAGQGWPGVALGVEVLNKELNE